MNLEQRLHVSFLIWSEVAVTIVPAMLYMTRQEHEDHPHNEYGKKSSAAGERYLPATQQPDFRRLSCLMGTATAQPQ